MKKLLFALMAIALLGACQNPDDKTDVEKPTPTPANDFFTIDVREDTLCAWGLTFDVQPAKPDATYYYDIISKARLSTVDVASIKAELIESANKFAEWMGGTPEEALATLLNVGNKTEESYAGYRPETEFCIYAFYWDDATGESFTTVEFATPAEESSNESVEVVFDGVEEHSLCVECAPSAGVAEYYYYFADKATVERMFAVDADEQAYKSYHAMNVGTKYAGTQSFRHQGLKAGTDYVVLVMAIDQKGNRFIERAEQVTTATTTKPRVESALFENLLGEWTATQQIYDPYYQATTPSDFTVTIVSAVEDLDYDFRAQNQLVALVDGWMNIPYYSIGALETEYESLDEHPEPVDAFGPKWIIDIAEGDKVSIDGSARYSTVGWLFMGDCFLLNAHPTEGAIYSDGDFEVEVSADGNTIRISSPEEYAGCYPSLAYMFEGFGWMAFSTGTGASDIVLTRK